MVQKYIGIQVGVNVVKLRVGTEEVELSPKEVDRIRTSLAVASMRATLKRM